LQEMRLPTDSDQIERTIGRISQFKNGMLASDSSLVAIRERYDGLLQKMNAVDFDDLMLLPIRILEGNAEAQALWRERARHFLIDEYQDSSRVQYELVRLLVPPTGNLTVVGDDDQSIYGWRGAEVKNLFQLDRDYEGLSVARLEQNYRSTGAILGAANTLIAHNGERLGKTLRASLGQGKPVRIWQADSSEDEAQRVVSDMQARRAADDLSWGDFCVLYRAAHLSRELELAMRRARIPYQVSGSLSFFDRAEIKDLLAYMRLIANGDDDLAFVRSIGRPRRGIGEKALGDLGELAHRVRGSLLDATHHPDLAGRNCDTLREFGNMIANLEYRFRVNEPGDAFDALLKDTRLEELIVAEAEDDAERERRMSNVFDLRRWWLRHAEEGGKLPDFLQQISLLADREEEENDNAVRLMTVHASKGLEFGHVYLVGAEEGTFPHKNAVEENRIEEERRLMYVAITRARFRLTVSMAKVRSRFGDKERTTPSRFLNEMGEEHVVWVDRDINSEAATEEAESAQAQIRRMLGLG